MSGFENDVLVAKNVNFDFTANPPHSGILTANGDLIIGSTADPNIQALKGKITSPLGTLNVGYSAPNITLDLAGGSTGIDSIAVQTGTSPVVPTGAGLVTINGTVVAAGINPLRTNGTGANTLALEVQKSQAIAAADATKIGLSNFDSAKFTVDGNGFVSTNSSGFVTSIAGTANQISSSASTGAVTLSTPSTFIAPGSIQATTNVTMPQANAGGTQGLFTLAGTKFLWGISNNISLGLNAGNLASGANNQVCIGASAGAANTTAGANCVYVGTSAGAAGTDCVNNVAVGLTALASNVHGSQNVFVGALAGNTGSGMNLCVGVGDAALTNVTGDGNTACGFGTMQATTGGMNNTACGRAALISLVSGSTNSALGYLSGTQYNGAESGNICIDNIGVNGESNVTRIGTNQTSCYIKGIASVAVTNQLPVFINSSTGQLGTTAVSSFSAYLSAPVNNVTGNATAYQTICDTKSYDILSDYNNSTGVFTCRNTGVHQFIFKCYFSGCTVATTLTLQIVTTTLTYSNQLIRAAGSSDFNLQMTINALMTAGNTAAFKVVVTGEAADTCDLFGDNTNKYDGTYVQGRWLGPS